MKKVLILLLLLVGLSLYGLAVRHSLDKPSPHNAINQGVTTGVPL